MEPIEDVEPGKFAWSVLFVVTAVSSLLFNLALKYLDGESSRLLLWISLAAGFMLILNWFGRMIHRQGKPKERTVA